MTHIKTSSALRSIYVLFFASFFLALCFSVTYAQEATGSAVQKYKITFPISTLGNCATLESCKEYCEDSTHQVACENFAKSKGFYKAPDGQGNARSKIVLEKAKEELGCTSDQTCKDFCKDEANREKCSTFAQKYRLGGPKKVSSAVLEKARTALGCTSEETCKAVCKEEANREKCSYFAKQVGLHGGMVTIKTDGKNQQGFEQIKSLMERCQNDPAYCQQNMATIEAQLAKQSEAFCKTNPEKCNELRKGVKEATRGGKFMPNSDKAYENANTNAKFCRENPEKCANASGSGNMNGKPVQMGKPDKNQVKKPVEIREPKVQGVSTSQSLIDRIAKFLFR